MYWGECPVDTLSLWGDEFIQKTAFLTIWTIMKRRMCFNKIVVIVCDFLFAQGYLGVFDVLQLI